VENKKLKVLWYSDSPTTATGFATVAKNLLKVLYATGKYEFTCVGINHNGAPYDRVKFPYDIYPAVNPLASEQRYRDVYGRQMLIDMAATGAFDLVFMIQDTFIVETFMAALLDRREKLAKDKKFAIIHYFPIDGAPKKSWVENVVAKVDIPVAYTHYAKNECLKLVDTIKDMRVIYHGVDKDVFYPPTDNEFRKKFFTEHADKFIILNVNRNQPRKDLHKTFAGYAEFHKKYPNSFLFLLTQMDDVGGNLAEIAEHYGLKWDEDWGCPAPNTYGANQGYPVEIVNMIYGACDVVVSTTTGEGWGLSYSECSATERIALFPKNTSLIEMKGENEERGYFIKSGFTKKFPCVPAT
jgi:glycosyltransferase involved in cell wall biosynthesis